MYKKVVFVIGLLMFFYAEVSLANFSWDGYSYMTGYMVDNSFTDRKDYEIVPMYLTVSKDIKAWLRKKGVRLWENIELEFELGSFINPVIAPDNNVEIGVTVGLIFIAQLSNIIQPYLRVGIGPGYTTQHTSKQATQWNFFSWASVGIVVPLFKKTDLLLEYRIRHFSNGGIKKPNKGINHGGVLLGFRYKF